MCACDRLIAAVVVVLLYAAVSLHATAAGRNAHPAGSACGDCHVAGAEAGQAQAPKLLATQEVLCIRCHARAVEASHPTGFVPRRKLPKDYPLDWKGDLTCSTCHIVHGGEPGLLRGKKHAREFCLDCHDPMFFRGMKDAGTSLLASGHLDLGRLRGTVDIDRHSLNCLGCHAGGHAGGGTVSVGRNGVLRHASGSAPHPIGRSYREASRNGGFRPEHELAQKKILLADGRISCVSCHEGYRKDHGRLVLPLTRSALCLACHAK